MNFPGFCFFVRRLRAFCLHAGGCLAEARKTSACWGPLDGDGGVSEGIKIFIVYVREVEGVLLDRGRVEIGDAADRGLGP